ncbi:unnamed protein product [marine sediment metagenome]|uniref:Uncharacterized protein n=1 Tax=marine sediment metagenome TaxID=412755 RepID=X1U8T5_9ZZZZ
MLAIAQADPDYYMSVLANKDISEVIVSIIKDEGLTDETKQKIMALNELDNVFREISAFMQEVEDMLSIGSFMTGELEKKRAFMELYGGQENG